MASVSEYKRQVEALNIEENLRRTVSSTGEAKALKKDCISYQKDLRQIKKTIGLEIKEIRAQYRDKIANAGSVMGGAFSLFGKRGLGGSIRADAKRATSRERDSIVAPYEELKLIIDNFIHAIDDSKLQIDGFINELKAEESLNKSKKPTTGNRFCGSCGAKAAKSNKFCTQCGAKLDET